MAGDTADEADGADARNRQAVRPVADDRQAPDTAAALAVADAEAEPAPSRAAGLSSENRGSARADEVAAPVGTEPVPARQSAGHAAENRQDPGAGAVPVPAPTDTAAAPAVDPARKAARREMSVALLLVAVGAALVLSLAGRVWAKGAVTVHDSRFVIEASGSSVTKLPTALALLALAAGVAALATRGRGRLVVGAILALGGAGIVAAAVSGASDQSTLDSRAAAKAAIEGVRAIDVGHTVWPWITALGGVLVLLGGLIVIARGRNWPGMGSRYETPSARPRRRAATPADMWNALDRGEDPTR